MTSPVSAGCRGEALCLGLLLVFWPGLGGADSSIGADGSKVSDQRALYERLETCRLWSDRAQALKKVIEDSQFKKYRATCWRIGEEWSNSLQVNIRGQPDLFKQICQASEMDDKKPKTLISNQNFFEDKILRPLPPTHALAQEFAAESFRRKGEATRTKACVEMNDAWRKALRLRCEENPIHQPELARWQETVDGRTRHEFMRQEILADIFASNNSGLPSLLSDSTGVAERMGGTDAVAVSMVSALGKDGDTVGTQAMATVRVPFQTPDASMSGPRSWSFLIRLNLPLQRAQPDTSGLQFDDSSGSFTTPSIQRYGLTVGWDLSDNTDARKWTPTNCLQAIDAITPFPAEMNKIDVERMTAVRRDLYKHCMDALRRDLRWGLRAHGQWMTQRIDGSAQKNGPSALALGAVLGREDITGMIAWRRGFEGHLIEPQARQIDAFVLAANFGVNLGAPREEGGHRLRLGLDISTSFLVLRGDNRVFSLEGLIAPSLLIRLGSDVFGTVALGYIASPTRAGLLLTGSMTVDVDRFLSSPPLSSSL